MYVAVVVTILYRIMKVFIVFMSANLWICVCECERHVGQTNVYSAPVIIIFKISYELFCQGYSKRCITIRSTVGSPHCNLRLHFLHTICYVMWNLYLLRNSAPSVLNYMKLFSIGQFRSSSSSFFFWILSLFFLLSLLLLLLFFFFSLLSFFPFHSSFLIFL